MAKHQFIEFVGGCAIAGKQVAAYATENGVQLRAETVGFKIMGPVRNISADEFEQLKSQWYEGVHHQDARIVERALAYLGLPLQ